MQMNLAERLVHARRESGFPEPADAAKRAGITPSALYQLEDGKTKSLKGHTAVQLGKVYRRFRVEWLITGELPMEHNQARSLHRVADGSPVYVSDQATPPGYLRLPLLAMEGGMGFGAHNDDLPEVVSDLDVAEWWAQSNFPKPLSRIKVMTGRGDSNAGLINHGDIVFVDSLTNFFDGEGLYVFNWQGRALIKRLAPDIRGTRLQILSANPAYPPETIDVHELEDLHIAGRVVAWWTLRQS